MKNNGDLIEVAAVRIKYWERETREELRLLDVVMMGRDW